MPDPTIPPPSDAQISATAVRVRRHAEAEQRAGSSGYFPPGLARETEVVICLLRDRLHAAESALAVARAEVERLKLALVGEEKARNLLNAGLGTVCESRDEMKHENRSLRAEVERLVRDSCDDHTRLQNACRKAGIAERLIVGDSHGVPGIGDLADMLMARVAELEAALRPMADMPGPAPSAGGLPETARAPRVSGDVADLLPAIDARSATHDVETAIDRAMDFFDDLLLEGRFSECDVALGSLIGEPVRHADSSVLVSILSITRRAKGRLPARQGFFSRVQDEIARRKGPRYANGLLEKYR